MKNKQIWKLSFRTGSIIFIILFLIMFIYVLSLLPNFLGNLGLIKSDKIQKFTQYGLSFVIYAFIFSLINAVIISIPSAFIRKITHSSQPKMVFLLSIPYLFISLGSILLIYPLRFHGQSIGHGIFLRFWGYYLSFLVVIGLIIYFYFKDTR